MASIHFAEIGKDLLAGLVAVQGFKLVHSVGWVSRVMARAVWGKIARSRSNLPGLTGIPVVQQMRLDDGLKGAFGVARLGGHRLNPYCHLPCRVEFYYAILKPGRFSESNARP